MSRAALPDRTRRLRASGLAAAGILALLARTQPDVSLAVSFSLAGKFWRAGHRSRTLNAPVFRGDAEFAAAVLAADAHGTGAKERSPFLFFTDCEDAALQAAVTRGRQKEFASFGWRGEVPDPQSRTSFCRSKLNWGLQASAPHAWLWDYYHQLLELRRRYPVLGVGGKRRLRARIADERVLVLLRKGPDGAAALGLLNVSPERRVARMTLSWGEWRRVADSGEERFGGFGPKTPDALEPGPAG